MTTKRRIAVLFGGRSPEHDVSVVTGLQALAAVDASAYDAFPVYISTDGNWFVGEPLRDRAQSQGQVALHVGFFREEEPDHRELREEDTEQNSPVEPRPQ